MEWKKVKLGEIGKIITGKTPPTRNSENYGGDIPFITPVDMVGNRSIYTTERYLTTKGINCVKSCLLPKNAICVSCIGSDMGKVVITTKSSVTNQQINSLIVSEKYDYMFVYYAMQTLNAIIKLLGRSSTAVPIINKSQFSNLTLSLPPLPYQRRISSILSDYDSLIENYQRQISLLEESAKRIYKEWFVDFKFPGVEMAENGLPKGWQKKKLGEICEIKSGFAFKSEWWTTDGYPVLKIKDIDNNTIDCSNLDFVAKDKVEKVKLFKLSEGDLVIAMTGATIGKIGIVPKIDNLYTNQRVGKFFLGECPFDKLPFVFCFFIKEETQKQIISLSSSSSAQPNISGDQLMGLTENYSFEMVDKFNNDMKPLFIKICNLRTQIRLLRQSRDILLPRLINGKIEIEG